MAGVDNITVTAGGGLDKLAASSGAQVDAMRKGYSTNTAEAAELSDQGIDIDIISAGNFPAAGNARITRAADGVQKDFAYTSIVDNTLSGCTITAGTFSFAAGDLVETL